MGIGPRHIVDLRPILSHCLECKGLVLEVAGKYMNEEMQDLQDVLGDHQDAEVASSYLRGLSVARGRRRRLPPETIFVMGAISHRYEVQARELRSHYPKAYRRAVGKRWKKLRSAMEKAALSNYSQAAGRLLLG